MRTTTGTRWLWIGLGMVLVMSTTSPTAADPRGEMQLTWTAPGLPGQQAALYDLRISYVALTTDTTGWWNAATPLSGVPAPAVAGIVQTFSLSGLEPGRTLYAAIRAQYAGGAWSPLTAVPPVLLPGGPFLQKVTPVRIDTDGPRVFTLTGLGLGGVSDVRFVAPSGSAVIGAGLQIVNSTTVQVTADLSPFDGEPVAVHATAWPGEDILTGWVEVDIADGGVNLPDTMPPETVVDLHAAAVNESSARLTWTAPADPAPTGTRRAAAYEIRRLAGGPGAWTWSGGAILGPKTPASPGTLEALLVAGLDPETTYGFALVAVDSAGNVSAMSNLGVVTLPAADQTVEPTAVTDLAAGALDTAAVRLTWTAPVLDTPQGPAPVAFYELRRLGGEPGNWSWTSGEVIETGTPAAPGEPESLTVSGLTPGALIAFALISSDGAGEWSRVSNTTETSLPLPPDTTPPAPVTDLQALLGPEGEVSLTWTAPADDRGEVGGYVVRCWDGDAESFNWDEAVDLADPPAPAAPGQGQQWTACTVASGSSAVFALRSLDPAGNPSSLSNLAVVDRTTDDVIPPASPAELTATRFGVAGVQIRWVAPGDDGTSGRAQRYELRHALSPVAAGWMESAEEMPVGKTPKPPGKVEFLNLRNLHTGVVHLFALRAVDEAGGASEWAVAMVHVDAPEASGTDTAPPPAPDSLSALRGVGGVQLSWNAVGVPNLLCYRIYRCGDDGVNTCLGDVPLAGTGYYDAGAPSGILRYTVSSVDEAGNESRLGASVTVPGGPTIPDLGLCRSGGAWRLWVEETAAAGEAGPGVEPLVQVFDVQGRLVAEIPLAAGSGGWEASWSGRASDGRSLPTGVFFLRATRGDWRATRKIVLR